jgi:hypothetical protein
MQVLLASVQWGLENDSMIEWTLFFEQHFAKFRQDPHIPWKLDGSSFLWPQCPGDRLSKDQL